MLLLNDELLLFVPVGWAIGALTLLVAFVYQVFRRKPLSTVNVDGQFLWLRGADPQFIAECYASQEQ